MEYKSLVFKDVNLEGDDGVISGYANVFNYRDHSGDITMPGAFKKTIKENKGKFLLLDNHDRVSGTAARLGIAQLEENEKGLHLIEGKFNMAKVNAQEAFKDVKFYAENKLPLKMSIGYKPIKWDFQTENNQLSRLLYEVKLYETSIVTLADNDKSTIDSYKSRVDEIEKLQKEIDDIKTLLARQEAVKTKSLVPSKEHTSEYDLWQRLTSEIQKLKGEIIWKM